LMACQSFPRHIAVSAIVIPTSSCVDTHRSTSHRTVQCDWRYRIVTSGESQMDTQGMVCTLNWSNPRRSAALSRLYIAIAENMLRLNPLQVSTRFGGGFGRLAVTALGMGSAHAATSGTGSWRPR
jgi:hypothetical protein